MKLHESDGWYKYFITDYTIAISTIGNSYSISVGLYFCV